MFRMFSCFDRDDKLTKQKQHYSWPVIEHLKDVHFFPVYDVVGNTHLSNEEFGACHVTVETWHAIVRASDICEIKQS